MAVQDISRKGFLTRAGALVVSFSFAPTLLRALTAGTPALASAVNGDTTMVDSWLAIAADGSLTVFCGKVELGTGVQTALSQIVVEELYLDFDQLVNFVQGDTATSPNQGYTAGSQSVQGGGVQLRQAAATAFQQLLTLASQQLGVPTTQLVARDGKIGVGKHARNALSYGQLIGGRQFNLLVNTSVTLKDPGTYATVGDSVPRVDLPAKFFGQFTYVQDVVVPGMLYGRVVRPAGRNASLLSMGTLPAGLSGAPRAVSKGNFVGVVATDEWAAIQAAAALGVTWQQGAPLAATYDGSPTARQALIQALQNPTYIVDSPTVLQPPVPTGNLAAGLSGAASQLQATYFTPYHMHAAIGPSCGVADVRGAPDPVTGIQATIWSGTQGVYFLRDAIAQLLGLPKTAVRVIYVEASGCYGHNGADDAAADAALLSQLVGAPVRVQWMRPDEHGWEPLGPAMVHAMQGGLDVNGNVVAWGHSLWSQTHSTRPGGLAGNLLAGQELGFAPQGDSPVGANAGGRNSGLNYAFPNYQVTGYDVKSYTTALNGTTTTTTNVLPRTTALRTLGGLSNVFANESFMDEMAMAANADPLDFRLRYLSDPRALAVLNAMAKESRWTHKFKPHRVPKGQTAPLYGRGLSYLQYENSYAYVAAYAEVAVDPTTGIVQVTRVVVAHDCGLIVNPDGLLNQIEGNVIQATSRALKEEVLFDANNVTGTTWAGIPTANTWSTTYKAVDGNNNPEPSYQILHFTEIPNIEIVLIDQPTQPAWGAGEPASEAMPAAIGNAIFDATGVRLRSLPFSPANVLAALNAGS